MDKVRAQANQIAQKTQETARDSKIKFDQAQAKRRGDMMLRNLGAVVYADRTGRGTGDSAAEIDRLVTQIASHEAEHEISLAREPADAAPDTGQAGTPDTGSADPPDARPADAPDNAPDTGPAADEGFPPSKPAGYPPAGEASAADPPAEPPAAAPDGQGFPPEAG